jgi:hypothetical protein
MTGERAAALASWRAKLDQLAREQRTVTWCVAALCLPDPVPRFVLTTNPEAVVAGLITGTTFRPPQWAPDARVQSWTVPFEWAPLSAATRARVLALAWDVLLSPSDLLAAGATIPATVRWSIRRATHEFERQRGRWPNRRTRRARHADRRRERGE